MLLYVVSVPFRTFLAFTCLSGLSLDSINYIHALIVRGFPVLRYSSSIYLSSEFYLMVLSMDVVHVGLLSFISSSVSLRFDGN